MLEAVSRPKIRDIVAEKLTHYSTSQGLKPGDRLPTENELAASFGVDRLSLREATKASSWVELDIALHRRLVEARGLPPLLIFSDLWAIFFHSFRESVRKADWKEGIESHQRLIDALHAGRLAAAREELQRHIESHQQRMEGESCR